MNEVAVTPAYLQQLNISKTDAATIVGSEIQVAVGFQMGRETGFFLKVMEKMGGSLFDRVVKGYAFVC